MVFFEGEYLKNSVFYGQMMLSELQPAKSGKQNGLGSSYSEIFTKILLLCLKL